MTERETALCAGLPPNLVDRYHCLVLVIDKQRWFFDRTISPFLGESPARAIAALDDIDAFIGHARDAQVRVGWTVTEENPDRAPNIAARWERRPGEPRLERGDVGFEFAGRHPLPTEPVFEKIYPDAFSNSGVASFITESDISTVVLVGGFAGRCVLATAFGAQQRGLHVVAPRGLSVPHPATPDEDHVFWAIVDTAIGFVVEPSELLATWGQGQP